MAEMEMKENRRVKKGKRARAKSVRRAADRENKISRAHVKYVRQAPRKVRLVADLVRGKSVMDAYYILQYTNKRAVEPVQKLLRSAVANAINNFDMNEGALDIAEIYVDEGPTLKRWMPRAKGRATPIRKRTSHITIVLKEREGAH